MLKVPLSLNQPIDIEEDNYERTIAVHLFYVYVSVTEHYCDPLGNDNIFSTVRPILRNNTSPVIIVAARVCTVCCCNETT